MLFEEFQDGHHGGYLEYWNNHFSSSESVSPQCLHQVLAQSDLLFRSRCGVQEQMWFKIVAILNIGTE